MFKKAIILYGCQIYKAILPLVFTPIILNALGTERYGMIAFYYMLVGLLGLLDVGISGSFLKLVATNRNSADNYKRVTMLFIKVSMLFCLIASILIACFQIGDQYIVTRWLNTSIEKQEAIYSINAIGFILAAQYVKSYLSSFVNGMEKQEWITIWSVLYSSIFYFGSVYAIRKFNSTLFVYFDMMLALAAVDILVIVGLVTLLYIRHNKKLIINENALYEIKNRKDLSFRSVLYFAMQLSGLSIIWVVATQVDKFVLSAYIPLEEYAKYQIAVQLCAAIAIFSGPLTQLLLPRLSNLYVNNQFNEYAKLYCTAMLIFIVILAPIMPYFFVFGDDLIALWMHDSVLAKSINIYAKWLVSAAFISAMMNFLFICLYTSGQLKQHFYAYALYSFFTIPLSIWIAKNYGGQGSAKFVFLHTIIFMFIWGGGQIRYKFPSFIKLLCIIFGFVIVASTLFFTGVFYVLDNLDYPLWIKVFIPPLVNFLVLFLFLYIFRDRFLLALTEIKFVVKS